MSDRGVTVDPKVSTIISSTYDPALDVYRVVYSDKTQGTLGRDDFELSGHRLTSKPVEEKQAVRQDVRVEVVPIGEAKADPDVVAEIEKLLEAAKAGRVRGVSAIMSMIGGDTNYLMVGRYEVVPTLGLLARLQHQVQLQADAVVSESTL